MPAHQAQGPAGPPGGELTAILAEVTGPGGQFRHRQHINLAFLAVRRYGMPEATARICDWIRHIAAYQRAPQKYHHTVSRAWVEIVAHHVAADPDCADFETFAGAIPRCLTSACSAGTTGHRPWPPRQPGRAGSSPTSYPSPGRRYLGGSAGRRLGRRRRIATSAEAARVAMRRPTGILPVPVGSGADG